jgi:excisionase family DNA binding protein
MTTKNDAGKPAVWLTTNDVAARLGVHRSTVDDWMRHGVPVAARGGERVKLRFSRIGTQMKTRRRWVREFIAACNPQAADFAPSARASPKADDAAERDWREGLRQRGVKV